MSRAIDLKDVIPLKTSQLEKTGEDYELVLLSAKNIDQILALEDVAFAALTKEEEAFLLKKDRAFFESHFANGNAMLGIVHNGTLIAQSVILNPTAAHPKTGMVDMPELSGMSLESVTVQQGVIVDPAYRGNHLMGVMVEEWLSESKKSNRTEVISEVATENPFSWDVYLQNGMHIESIGTDPDDGTVVYNMHGHIPSLSADFNAAAAKKAVPAADITQQKELVEQGYKGVAYDRKSGTLQFQKTRAVKNCL